MKTDIYPKKPVVGTKKNQLLESVVEIAAIAIMLRFVLNLLPFGIAMFPGVYIDEEVPLTLVFVAGIIIYIILGWKAAQHDMGLENALKAGAITGLLVSIAVSTVRKGGFLFDNLDFVDFAAKTAAEIVIATIVVCAGAWLGGMAREKKKGMEEF